MGRSLPRNAGGIARRPEPSGGAGGVRGQQHGRWHGPEVANRYGDEQCRLRRAAAGRGARQLDRVGFIEGAGTTSEPQSYRFTDQGLPYEADRLEYRLRQVDIDGSASYSETVTVERGVAELELLSTYPNPAQSQAVVRYAVPENQDVAIRLYDTLGRQVRTVFRGKQEGRKKQQIDLSGLSSGVFFLRLRAGGATKTQKLTVMR